jgi:hypothetical protein
VSNEQGKNSVQRTPSDKTPEKGRGREADASDTFSARTTETTMETETEAVGRHCRTVADGIVKTFISRLADEARRNGGVVAIEERADIEAIARDVAENLKTAFSRSFETHAEETRMIREHRADVFGRLLVGEFEHLLPTDEVTVEDGALSRRVLPGFFACARMMLGPAFMDGAERLCAGIMEQSRERADDDAWDAFRRSADARGVLLDALMAISGFFRQPEQRVQWFIDIANSRLHRPVDVSGEDSDDWRLTRDGASKLWCALFARLRDAIDDPLTRAELAARQGREKVNEALLTVERMGVRHHLMA